MQSNIVSTEVASTGRTEAVSSRRIIYLASRGFQTSDDKADKCVSTDISRHIKRRRKQNPESSVADQAVEPPCVSEHVAANADVSCPNSEIQQQPPLISSPGKDNNWRKRKMRASTGLIYEASDVISELTRSDRCMEELSSRLKTPTAESVREKPTPSRSPLSVLPVQSNSADTPLLPAEKRRSSVNLTSLLSNLSPDQTSSNKRTRTRTENGSKSSSISATETTRTKNVITSDALITAEISPISGENCRLSATNSEVPRPSSSSPKRPPQRFHDAPLGKMPAMSLLRRQKGGATHRIAWTNEETQCLRDGVRIYGAGNWVAILAYGRSVFHPNRTSVNLKDRWRTLNKQ